MPLRVLIVSYLYPPSIGGVERQSYLLARGLVARGHAARVIASRVPTGTPVRERSEGVEIRRIPRGSGGRWRRMATFLAGLSIASVPWIRWADVVQVQQALYPAAMTALIAGALRRPVVVRDSSSGPYGAVRVMRGLPFGRAALRVIARSAVLVALNAEMEDELRVLGATRIVRIPSGVEEVAPVNAEERAALRSGLGVAGGLVLYLGRLEEEKGVETLVQAWGLCSAPADLLIVGDGPSQAALAALAVRIGARRDSLQFVGPASDAARYVRAADVLVLPSRSEGIANAGLEAMAAGTPVIATDVGGNRELIPDATIGTLVPPDDPPALARAIDTALSDPSSAAARANAARTRVLARHSLEGMIDAYERLYAGIVGRTA